jgi:Na+/H+ antiporter NhaD/arsenite permease-like protein
MKQRIAQLGVLVTVPLALFFLGAQIGLSVSQSLALSIFSASVCGTLFFWPFRLSFAFMGTSILLLTKTVTIHEMIVSSSLDVILFLAGMMIVVALLKESGFFAWIVEVILRIRNLTASRFVLVISLISALLSAVTGEVVSIVFMVAAIFEICDYFEVDPIPFIILSVFATNIGSAATVLGNPIGILIATKSGLNGEDFLKMAMPIALVCLFVTIGFMMFVYRRHLAVFDAKIKELGANDILIRLISVPIGRDLRLALFVLAITVGLISFSGRIEVLLGLETNVVLLTTPLLMAAGIMAWKQKKARDFVEKDVEWWSLLFFLFLFVQAGTLHSTGATRVLSEHISRLAGGSHQALLAIVLWSSSITSSILDNVVVVVAFIPIIKSLNIPAHMESYYWWALLLGGCLGGNITAVGSTANIVALGLVEKERRVHVSFARWLGLGLGVGVVTTAVAWGLLTVMMRMAGV